MAQGENLLREGIESLGLEALSLRGSGSLQHGRQGRRQRSGQGQPVAPSRAAISQLLGATLGATSEGVERAKELQDYSGTFQR